MLFPCPVTMSCTNKKVQNSIIDGAMSSLWYFVGPNVHLHRAWRDYFWIWATYEWLKQLPPCALFSNLFNSCLENYVIKHSKLPLVKEVPCYQFPCPIKYMGGEVNLLHKLNFYARARGSRHQGEYILVVVIVIVVVLFFCHLLKWSRVLMKNQIKLCEIKYSW